MAYISDNTIANIVGAIITTRDFCGDEREAAVDAAFDAGLRGADITKAVRIANFRANAAWNGFKKAAGVNPKYTF
jgi:hypothetical protein